jgi:hypothetical protein
MYKALKSFAGKVSMRKGEVKEINDKEIVKDLLNAGYIEEVKPAKKEKKVQEVQEELED